MKISITVSLGRRKPEPTPDRPHRAARSTAPPNDARSKAAARQAKYRAKDPSLRPQQRRRPDQSLEAPAAL